jgi:hypothetical protein
VTSGRRERSSSSLSALCVHPHHCSATRGTATTSPTLLEHTGMGRCHSCHCTSYGPPLTAPSSRPAGSGRTTNLYTTTLEATPVRAQDAPRRPKWSKICQDGRQPRGTASHASTRRGIVRHTCKLLSPWPIKGRAIPQPQERRRRIAITLTLSAFTTILALASINTSVTWRPGLLSRHTCSPPSTSTTVQCNIVPRASHCWTYSPAGTRIKPSAISCLARAHREVDLSAHY